MSEAKGKLREELDGHPGAAENASRYHRGHYRGLLRALTLVEDSESGGESDQ